MANFNQVPLGQTSVTVNATSSMAIGSESSLAGIQFNLNKFPVYPESNTSQVILSTAYSVSIVPSWRRSTNILSG